MPQKKRDKKKKKRMAKVAARQGLSLGSGILGQDLLSDDDNESILSTNSSTWSFNLDTGGTEVVKDYSDKAIDLMEELTNRRSSIRLRSLEKLAKLFKKHLLQNFALEKRETLSQYLKSSIRKGQGMEVSLACRVFTLLVITLGAEVGNMHSSIWNLFEAYIRNPAKSVASRTAVTELLGLICFTGEQEDEEILQSLELIAQIWKQGLRTQFIDDETQQSVLENKVVKTVLRTEELTTQALESWSLICTVAPPTITKKHMELCQSQLIKLLDHHSLQVRRAAGEALALEYSYFTQDGRVNKRNSKIDMWSNDWSLIEDNDTCQEENSISHESDNPVLDLIIEKISALAKDGNRRRSKKERAKQRSFFRDIVRTFEGQEEPNEIIQVGKDKLEFYGWAQMIQLAAFRRCLDRGLQYHIKKNEFLVTVFDLCFQPENDKEDDEKEKRIRNLENQDRARMQDMRIANERKKKMALRGIQTDYWDE